MRRLQPSRGRPSWNVQVVELQFLLQILLPASIAYLADYNTLQLHVPASVMRPACLLPWLHAFRITSGVEALVESATFIVWLGPIQRTRQNSW
ncbi:hypothetical protein BU23DRAFT_87234 [Bimuria novae-zelandiae CBS 107.79]|uniref:Uncharacterized protein n=1 Tax=Bimuria novae-zelandiae CBS 107.79 TaxID=1447943 RepID=A0A6A5VD31_9PLEO|nr:hypothetical protein BU23DRAFT_87234 [Bimuria novae-zelandiae CBS 107.79]